MCLSLRETALLTYNSEQELQSIVYETPWDTEYDVKVIHLFVNVMLCVSST